MRDRSATNTILGYFYQFDYAILQLLRLKLGKDSIIVEGIEDVDVSELDNDVAIQCKYYSNTEYNHSEIAKPIRLMLRNYKERKVKGLQSINYKIYGFYKSGQHKLPAMITVDFMKKYFFTYTHNKVKIIFHEKLDLSEKELEDFRDHLQININAENYASQLESLLDELQNQFDCSKFEAEHYYYNNSLRLIKEISTNKEKSDRQITKDRFLQEINKKELLFNKWFYYFKGEKEVFRNLKKEYFSDFNMMPYERFFLLDIDNDNYSRVELKDIIFFISHKWSKLSKRTQKTFCPYLYIHNISEEELVNLKTDLFEEGFKFIDGFCYSGAKFNAKSLTLRPTDSFPIQVKILDELEYLDQTLREIDTTKEIYQFYKKSAFYELGNPKIKHVKIQVDNIKHIKEII